MNDLPDARLLERFVHSGSEEAFATLVERYIALVHSTALRNTDDSQQAQDITQAVFIILAHKAGSLGGKVILAGWLYQTTRLTAANIQRAEARRLRREQEAFMQSMPQETTTDPLWRELSPQLDKAMAALSAGERDALVLRYFQNMSIADVGQSLGLTQNTAQKRVCRALEKLHRFFNKRGVTSTTAIIAGMILSNSVQAAPPALAQSVTAAAVAKGATAGSSTLTLVKGALKVMAWTKAKTVVVTGAIALLAAGMTTATIKEVRSYQNEHYPWQVNTWKSYKDLEKAPPLVEIARAKFPPNAGYGIGYHGKLWELDASLPDIIGNAYGTARPVHSARMVLLAPVPDQRYDFIDTLPSGQRQALQQLIKKQFGLVARFETFETNVLFLQIKNPGAPGLKPSKSNWSSWGEFQDKLIASNQAGLTSLADWLERIFDIPVVDVTGLTNHYDIDLKWGQAYPDGIKPALADDLGLELVPGKAPVEMLVVDKAQ